MLYFNELHTILSDPMCKSGVNRFSAVHGSSSVGGVGVMFMQHGVTAWYVNLKEKNIV